MSADPEYKAAAKKHKFLMGRRSAARQTPSRPGQAYRMSGMGGYGDFWGLGGLAVLGSMVDAWARRTGTRMHPQSLPLDTIAPVEIDAIARGRGAT